MNKRDTLPGHFYRTPIGDTHIYVYITRDLKGENWVGKYGEEDSVSYMNNLYFEEGKREYEEIPMTHPAFSEIGKYIIRNTFK